MTIARRMAAKWLIICLMACTAVAEMPIAEDMPIAQDAPLPAAAPVGEMAMDTAEDELLTDSAPRPTPQGDYAMASANDEPFQSVRVRAVGDLMVHQRQLSLAKRKDGTYDFHDAYSYVADSLRNADLTIGNLETTINVNNPQYSGYPMFNSPVSLLATLKDAGIDFLTLANNHMLDTRYDGMCSTVTQAEAYGFLHDGAYRTRAEAETPVLKTINGITIGFLSYTETTNVEEKYCAPEVKEFAVSYLKNADIPADVQRLREAGADLVICMPHWGIEYKRAPNATQMAWAQRMIAAGVDVIIGSHPHMVQPIEWVTVETDEGLRTGLVAWSLGNFISNMSNQFTDSGIILEFTVIRGLDGTISIDQVGYVPIYNWRSEYAIRAVCSGMYLTERPNGMNDPSWSRLRTSWSELIALLGSRFTILAQ